MNALFGLVKFIVAVGIVMAGLVIMCLICGIAYFLGS